MEWLKTNPYKSNVGGLRLSKVLKNVISIDRETPDHDLEKATHEELDRIGKLIKDSGIPYPWHNDIPQPISSIRFHLFPEFPFRE